MLPSSIFSHRRFRPTSAVVVANGRSSPVGHEKVTKSSTVPYGYRRTKHHLAIDTDPNTPTLKRFTNLNGVETRFQRIICENVTTRDVVTPPRPSVKPRQGHESTGTESDFASFSSSTSPSSSSPVSRPPSWTLGDGNWTLKRHLVDANSNSEFGFTASESGADQTAGAIDSPPSSASEDRIIFDSETPPTQPSSPPILTLSHYNSDFQSHHFDDTCCVCTPVDHGCRRNDSIGSVIKEETGRADPPKIDRSIDQEGKPDTEPQNVNTCSNMSLSIDQHRSPPIIDRSASSCSSTTTETKRSSAHYKSCPDLIRPCVLNVDSMPACFLTPSYGTLNTSRRKKWRARPSTNTPVTLEQAFVSKNGLISGGRPLEKPLRKWTLDDILMWLEKTGMEDVSSILVGYELSGSDLETWSDHILLTYGITDAKTRARLLAAVCELRLQHKPQLSPPNTESRLLARKWSRGSGASVRAASQGSATLYDVIKRSGHDRIVAIDLPDDVQPSRAFTVAQQAEGGLVISGCRNALIPLEIGDVILEYNGENCLLLAAVDFHVLTSQSNKNNKIVVLRKSECGASASTDVGSQTGQCSTVECSNGQQAEQQQPDYDDEDFCIRL